jgi:uncharacterized protein DUF1566
MTKQNSMRVALVALMFVALSGCSSQVHWLAWNSTLTANRFVPALATGPGGTVAFLDRETGLVWDGSPGAKDPSTTLKGDWITAKTACNALQVGNREGWRLPTVQELASLVDPGQTSSPRLPPGHPFTNVQPSFYWSATTKENPNQPNAWGVNFGGGAGNVVGVGVKTDSQFIWCVRGHQGVDPQ